MTKKTNLLNLNTRSAQILSKNTKKALRLANKEISKIANVPHGTKRTAANTFEPLNQATIIIANARSKASIFSAVHPDPKIRKAAENSIQKLADFSPKLYLRRDIYEAVRAVSDETLDKETKRFREKELLDFKLTGVDKPAKIRNEIKQLIRKAVKLGQAFDRNIKDDVRYLMLEAKDIAELPEDYQKSHTPDKEGMIRISTQYPDYFPFMQYAKDSDARKKLNFLYLNRGWPKNEKVLHELLAVRKRHAELLGYNDWADYITVDKMTGSANTVHLFLESITRLTQKPAKRDLEILLAQKKKDDRMAHSIETWDVSYYENLSIKEQIGFDAKEARNYFPFYRVKNGVLKTTERLFGLSYRRASVASWHPDVEVFDVYRNKKMIGRFYLDLHPRTGKYGHAACFDIQPGIRGKQLPEAALICNFSKDLMSHDEVTTFLHEFGHLIHFIMGGDQKWVRFSGFATEWDFVEAPSQMLEAWALDFKTISSFARHYKTRKPISQALVKKMREAENFNKGIWVQRQIFLAALSLRYHQDPSPKNADLSAIMRNEQKKCSAISYSSETHFYTGFGHLNEYSAIYYTYMWSLAIAKDILVPFTKKGMYDRNVSQRYVKEILMPGGSKDANDLIRNFLKRDWNLNAFSQWLNA